MFPLCFAFGSKCFSIAALIFMADTITAVEETGGDLIGRAQKAFSSDQRDVAMALATKAIETDPKNPRGYFVRARFHEESSEPVKALTDYDQALKLDPSLAEAWQNRGIIHFKLARIDESISDFDQFLKLNPAQAPYHWQRGICYYYARRFEDGRNQFELHQTVNPNDVENAVWHFLCVARSAGVDKARASLMPIREDARVPMMQIYALFAGKAKLEDVLRAARAGEPAAPELRQRLFYAHLYAGLYSEARGDETQAREHIAKAVHEYGGADYMSSVARVHLILSESKKKSRVEIKSRPEFGGSGKLEYEIQ
jgi:lipoprotein NlpI